MKGKTSCFNNCGHEHDCFGGYLSEDGKCDREIESIKKKLEDEYPEKIVLFAPKNGVGLRFKIIESPTVPDIVYILENGETHKQ